MPQPVSLAIGSTSSALASSASGATGCVRVSGDAWVPMTPRVLLWSSRFNSCTDIVLEEIPSLLVLRDNWNQNAAGVGLDQACREPGSATPCYKMVSVSDSIDLDGPYLAFADQRGVRARPVFRIETTWNPPNTKLSTEPGNGTQPMHGQSPCASRRVERSQILVWCACRCTACSSL